MRKTTGVLMSKNIIRKAIIAKLRQFELFSRTTPELDRLDLWLAGRPMYFLLILLTAPIVFFIEGLRPLLLVRFGVFNSDRIGAFAPEYQGYLITQNRKLPRSWTLDFTWSSWPHFKFAAPKDADKTDSCVTRCMALAFVG